MGLEFDKTFNESAAGTYNYLLKADLGRKEIELLVVHNVGPEASIIDGEIDLPPLILTDPDDAKFKLRGKKPEGTGGKGDRVSWEWRESMNATLGKVKVTFHDASGGSVRISGVGIEDI